MIFTDTPKKIRVHFTPFRDGLQSSFGGKVRLDDILPAMEYAAKEAGLRHLEFGGGARYQAPYFYVGENPFEGMDRMRATVGPDVDLQILTRSVSGVTLTTQRLDALALQARLMAKHGTTYDRNFDFMNDVDNLVKTGQPIVDAGMHHQVCVAMMGMPFHDDTVHTPEFYIEVVRRLLKSGLHFDSVCMKDASGTTDPRTCYETARGIKAILPPEVALWHHSHDTASLGVAQYMASIAAGADGVDLSCRPMASGTVQPDVRSLAHGLKGTGYGLDLDVDKIREVERLLEEGLADYDFDPVTTSADARVVGFPMPGGAIGPNVHMMKESGILDRYGEVLAEFPVVVKAGGAWTSVTPGSQQYWLQAFNNVLYGRWKKIDGGYGKSVLGYFGRTPLPPDPEVVKLAGEQLERARQPGSCAPGARGARLAGHRREHLPGGRGHRAGQEHGPERGHQAAHRQGEDRAAAQEEAAGRRTGRRSCGPAGGVRPGVHLGGDHALRGDRGRQDAPLHHHHRSAGGVDGRVGSSVRHHGCPGGRGRDAGLLPLPGQDRAGGDQRQGGRHGGRGAGGGRRGGHEGQA